ncbi:hypothetical protein Pmani_008956 [Petrolisthes manimaculis]|uniref:Uncharacterized protein n=1 Tax=Petrolisthes manimaculis TaxID=1843537 RepID=A0AAE1UDF8_9EUCA|nr:hypothetical protein Pmani_008956 [Petrolisthes manimaculis]
MLLSQPLHHQHILFHQSNPKYPGATPDPVTDRNARNDAQRIARRCANDYWLNLCQNIQLSTDCGNIRGMYDGMKKAQASLRLRP